MSLINSVAELENFLTLGRHGEVIRGVLVSSEIRKECMLSVNQNRISRQGRICFIQWTNHKGGVWAAWLDEDDLAHELN